MSNRKQNFNHEKPLNEEQNYFSMTHFVNRDNVFENEFRGSPNNLFHQYE